MSWLQVILLAVVCFGLTFGVLLGIMEEHAGRVKDEEAKIIRKIAEGK